MRLAITYCNEFYNSSGRKIYVPEESVEAYKTAEWWSDYADDFVAYDFIKGEVVEGGNSGGTQTNTVISFYFDQTNAGDWNKEAILMKYGVYGWNGHFFNLYDNTGKNSIVFTLADFDYALQGYETYQFATSHTYPISSTSPTQSCYFIEMGTSYFTLNNKSYTPFEPEQPTDSEGRAYGVELMTFMPEQDYNLVTFYMPCVDDEGNTVIIDGQYEGPLGYSYGY